MVLRVFVFALMVMVGFGCKKPKEPTEPEVPDLPVGVSMMADKQKWTATSYSARTFSKPNISGSELDSVLKIYSHDSVSDHSLFLQIDGWNGRTGTFSSPGGGGEYFIDVWYNVDPNNASASYHLVSCSMTITKITASRIQGVFDAIMNRNDIQDTISVTDGTFNVPFKP